jgi:hypothetical protein
VDVKVAATPSEIDGGLVHFSLEGGVHTPVFLSQCAGFAPALGTVTAIAANITVVASKILEHLIRMPTPRSSSPQA